LLLAACDYRNDDSRGTGDLQSSGSLGTCGSRRQNIVNQQNRRSLQTHTRACPKGTANVVAPRFALQLALRPRRSNSFQNTGTVRQIQLSCKAPRQRLRLVKPTLQTPHKMQWNRYHELSIHRPNGITLSTHKLANQRRAKQLVMYRFETQQNIAQLPAVASQSQCRVESMTLSRTSKATARRIDERTHPQTTPLARRLFSCNHLSETLDTKILRQIVQICVASQAERRINDTPNGLKRLGQPTKGLKQRG
jgi:hypothetical protein